MLVSADRFCPPLPPLTCSHFKTMRSRSLRSPADTYPTQEPSKKDSIKSALAALAIDPAETPVVYVGDTARDAECAAHAGCEFVGVNYGFEELASLPHPLVTTVTELAELLLRHPGGPADHASRIGLHSFILYCVGASIHYKGSY